MVEDPMIGLDESSWSWHEEPDEPEFIWEVERCTEIFAPVLELKVESKPLFDRSRAIGNEDTRFEHQIPRPVARAIEEHSRDSRFPKSQSNNLAIFRLTRRHVDAILLLKIVEIDRGASSMDLGIQIEYPRSKNQRASNPARRSGKKRAKTPLTTVNLEEGRGQSALFLAPKATFRLTAVNVAVKAAVEALTAVKVKRAAVKRKSRRLPTLTFRSTAVKARDNRG
ncbi:hypothetical protein CASFOL_042699 [Castilleja foliolosa]|uniref:Uncharacterized protein n=1 Tax=Castilleja foliolosa TaxID=1961234 RepID=A0ABD3B8H4_9LAMI